MQWEPWFTWKKLISWKTIGIFLIVLMGFGLGYYGQNIFRDRRQNAQQGAITSSGQPPSDQNEDPYIIDFSHQGLNQFPDFLLPRAEITDLILSDNDIPQIPDGISNMSKLRILDMRYNRLGGPVTASIADLGLVDVNLAHNEVTALPGVLGQMSSLRYLDVSFNKLSDVPDSVVNITGLKWLNLEGNDISQAAVDDLRQKMPSTIINF